MRKWRDLGSVGRYLPSGEHFFRERREAECQITENHCIYRAKRDSRGSVKFVGQKTFAANPGKSMQSRPILTNSSRPMLYSLSPKRSLTGFVLSLTVGDSDGME
jgi:hypothetical protein